MRINSKTINAISRVSGLEFNEVSFLNDASFLHYYNKDIYLSFMNCGNGKYKITLFDNEYNILGDNVANESNYLYVLYSLLNNLSIKNEKVYKLISKLKDDSLYLHKRKGTIYDLIIVSNDEVEDESYIETCTYIDILTGKKYSRPSVEFFDKFIKFGN